MNIDDHLVSPPRRPIYAIFEGGGAKGVAHVGALDAIAANRLDIIGVAGTSAGALAAVLVAIGLEADDLMHDTDPAANILAQYGQTPIGLLGEAAWAEFRMLGAAWEAVSTVGWWNRIVATVPLASRTLAIGCRAVTQRGHLDTTSIQIFVNKVVRERLLRIRAEASLDFDVPDDVRFADLNEALPTILPLKIVATDVARGSLVVFDRRRTPEVKIGEAVAASIAIPGVFRPATIPSFRPGEFVDGGLVSNFPIWVFAEEKLAYERVHFDEPPVPIVGFSLGAVASEDIGDQPKSLPSYLKALAETALSGSQTTTHRFQDDLIIVRLVTDLPLLAFDAAWDDLRRGREDGRRSADRELRFALDVKPELIRAELRAVRGEALDRLNAARSQPITHLRANLITPSGDLSLRVVEGVDMTGDADDRLLLDRRGRGAAQAFREKGLRIFQLGGSHDDPSQEFMTKYERALLRPNVKSAVCVPIFENPQVWGWSEDERPEPRGILTLDSDEDLAEAFNDHKFLDMLVDRSGVLYAAISLEPTDG